MNTDYEFWRRLIKSVNSPAQGNCFGILRGTCVSNDDPLHLGRIKVYSPMLHGKDQPNSDDLIWCYPCAAFGGVGEVGTSLIPDKGMTVWIAFEGGSTSLPIWIGGWWGRPDGKNSEIPNHTYQDKDGKLQKSPQHHVLYRYGDMEFVTRKDSSWMRMALNEAIFADLLKKIKFRIQVNDDTYIDLLDANKVVITSQGGVITVENQTIVATEAGGSKVTLSGGTVTAEDSAGAKVALRGGSVTLTEADGAEVSMSGNTVNITADIINLNGTVNMG